jgi:hypothetical protein
LVALAALVGPLSGCGSSSSQDGTPTKDGGVIVVEGGPVFCSNSNVVGSWELPGAKETAVYLFNKDGTYSLSFFYTNTSEEEEVTGKFAVSKQAILTTTPEKVTCTSSIPSVSSECTVSDGNLYLTDNATGVTNKWKPRASSADAGQVTLGCGTPFKHYPLMPVR